MDNYETYTTNFRTPNIDINDEMWSMRRVFSFIARRDNRLDNDEQHDSVDCLNEFLRYQNGLHNFRITYKNIKTCQNCSHRMGENVEVTDNIFKYVVENGPPINLTAALAKRDEHVTHCNNCENDQTFIERVQFLRTHDYFLMDLYRCDATFVGNERQPRDVRMINTPVGSLNNIKINTVENGQSSYNAIASITYQEGRDPNTGKVTPNSGHYYAHVKKNDRWFKVSDRTIQLDPAGPAIPRLLLLKKI